MDDEKRIIPKTVRVIPDLPAVSKEFDYTVPVSWIESGLASKLTVGSLVRIQFRNRSIGAWVSQINPRTEAGIQLQPLKKISSQGPSEEVLSLARWAADRWQGPISRFLKTASPQRMVKSIPPSRPSRKVEMPTSELVASAFGAVPSVVRISPVADRWPYIQAAVSLGNALILLPSASDVRIVVNRLRRMGVNVGEYSKDWAVGLSGGTVVGNRSAAFATVKDLSAILMIDEHDESFQEEASPTWHCREVVLERAKRHGLPCVFTSPIPTPEVRHQSRLISEETIEEVQGWSSIKVIDPREDDSAMGGLWPRSTIEALKSAERSIVVLNRTGRARLLACRQCGELVTCSDCGSAMQQLEDDLLECTRFGHSRPVLCSVCLSTSMKNLRIGVTRAGEELEALLNKPVTQVTKETSSIDFQRSKIYLGTEAVLHRVDWADLVVFADFDQELLAKRYRCEEQALSKLVRAIRLVNRRSGASGNVVVQSRQPNHPFFGVLSKGGVEAWCDKESSRRAIIQYPPFGHLAVISGPGSEEYITEVAAQGNLEILGPNDGAWLVKSPHLEDLSGALSRVPRPKKRLRLAIDPARF